jgi:hypothetical protein
MDIVFAQLHSLRAFKFFVIDPQDQQRKCEYKIVLVLY